MSQTICKIFQYGQTFKEYYACELTFIAITKVEKRRSLWSIRRTIFCIFQLNFLCINDCTLLAATLTRNTQLVRCMHFHVNKNISIRASELAGPRSFFFFSFRRQLNNNSMATGSRVPLTSSHFYVFRIFTGDQYFVFIAYDVDLNCRGFKSIPPPLSRGGKIIHRDTWFHM